MLFTPQLESVSVVLVYFLLVVNVVIIDCNRVHCVFRAMTLLTFLSAVLFLFVLIGWKF